MTADINGTLRRVNILLHLLSGVSHLKHLIFPVLKRKVIVTCFGTSNPHQGVCVAVC